VNYETLQWEATDKVGILTLNRPEKLNSFNLRMFEEIKEVLRRAEDDATTRAIVIKGSGTSFSAGGDMEFLKYLQGIEPDNSLENALTDILELGDRLYNLEIPTVVAVRGYCLGVGLSFALLGDIRLASENAVFGALNFLPWESSPIWD
jgi:enoyl-CoA hydratase/carnithine racemase